MVTEEYYKPLNKVVYNKSDGLTRTATPVHKTWSFNAKPEARIE